MAKQKSKEELERRRKARREKYTKIKNNPALYAAEREKKRLSYLKRKEAKKIKGILEMSPRDQRIQRKKWRESSKKYYKKKVSQEIIENVKQNDPLNAVERKTQRKYTKTELKLTRKIQTIKQQHRRDKQNLVSLLNRYRNRIRVLQSQIFKLKKIYNDEPENIAEDKKQLFDKLKGGKEKQIKSNLIDKKKFKHSKVATDLRKVCLRGRCKKTYNDNSIQLLIQNFYEDDINSRITPGKKQYKKKDGNVKQIRYLLNSMKNLHQQFLLENPKIKISYTTFTRLRPFWICLPIDDRDTCACKLHTNFNLLIGALNKNKILHAKDCHDLITEICCNRYNIDCLSRKCTICKEKTINYNEFRNDQEIQYMVWEKDTKKVDSKDVKIIKKKLKTSVPRQLIIKLENILPHFLSHLSNIVNQYTTIKYLKESLNSNETLIHMDFSENYSYKYAKEVQSMHFGASRGQVCLHTAVVYLKNISRTTETYSVCTVSESTRHDAAAIWAHLNYLIKFVFNKSPETNRIHILTDGPSSQYRNKKIFYIITQLRNEFPQLQLVTWNYQEAGHGKGAPDGVGAVIKRTADFYIKCQQDVGTFTEFVEIVRKNVKNVEIGIIEAEEIKIKELMLPKDIAPFKGTMRVHQVIWSSNSTLLEFRTQSCFECLNITCVHNKHIRYFKIYNDPVEYVSNRNVIPENKKIRVLSDITISYNNIATTSTNNQDSVTILRNVKDSWTNKTFVKNQTKASGHEKEFLKFIGQYEDSNDSV